MSHPPFLLIVASTIALAACSGGAAPQAVNKPATSPAQPMTAAALLDAPLGAPGAGAAPLAAAGAVPTPTLNTPMAVLSERDAMLFARLNRVEAEMAVLRNQMGELAPVIQKMPALQDKLTELVGELQRIDSRIAAGEPAADTSPASSAPAAVLSPVIAPAPTPQPEKTAPMPAAKPAVNAPATPHAKPVAAPVVATVPKPAPAATPAPQPVTKPVPQGPAILGVRVGDDTTKTRLVLDVNRRIDFSYDLDNSEKILVIDLQAPFWTGPMQETFTKSPLIAAYTVQTVGNGSHRLILQLRAPAKVLGTQVLAPNGDKSDRIVFDLIRDPGQ